MTRAKPGRLRGGLLPEVYARLPQDGHKIRHKARPATEQPLCRRGVQRTVNIGEAGLSVPSSSGKTLQPLANSHGFNDLQTGFRRIFRNTLVCAKNRQVCEKASRTCPEPNIRKHLRNSCEIRTLRNDRAPELPEAESHRESLFAFLTIAAGPPLSVAQSIRLKSPVERASSK